ncbi:MAG: hypothetical protein ACRDT0_02525 [Pseudonocardiaceae bacterium]
MLQTLCPDCGTVPACEDRGHEFTGWRRCRCEQLVAAHRAGPDGVCGVAFRYCLRCCVHESRPALAGGAAGGMAEDATVGDFVLGGKSGGKSPGPQVVVAAASASMCPARRDPAAEGDPTAATRAGGAAEVVAGTDTGVGVLA